MGLSEVLKSVQVLVGPDGKPSAVQISIEAWESMLDWLEDAEDRILLKEWATKLNEGPGRSAAMAWKDAKAQWEDSPEEPRGHGV